MKKNNTFLYSVKDNLVSEDYFNLFWDKQKKIAWTDLGELEDLDRYYESYKYISHHPENKSLINTLYNFARTIMLHYKFIKLKPLLKPEGKLLDIGCGSGDFLTFMDRKNFDVFGVENNKTALKICAKKKLKVYNSLKTLPVKSFDIVSLWHVLEHLSQPEEVIANIHNLLTRNGVLVIAVPNFSSHDRLHYQHNWAALDVPRHRWHFTPEGLEQMLFKSGFKLQKKSTLWLDVFYISYLSEKLKGNNLAFLRAVLKGSYFTLRSLFSKKHSTISFVFKKLAV
tara:strand:- start:749 stop:1597 length:849 start_codon:yes stop_codon:yes gene_type:complete